jgi:hypothetical protein
MWSGSAPKVYGGVVFINPFQALSFVFGDGGDELDFGGGDCSEFEGGGFDSGGFDGGGFDGGGFDGGGFGGQEVLFGQARIGEYFSYKKTVPDYLKGRSIYDVAEDLNSGEITPNMILIEAFKA